MVDRATLQRRRRTPISKIAAPGQGVVERLRERMEVPLAPPSTPFVDYLISTFSSNPLAVDGATGFETIASANIDSRWTSGQWYMEFSPNHANGAGTTGTILWQDSSGNEFVQYLTSSGGYYRLRSGGTFHNLTGGSWSPGDVLTFVMDNIGGGCELLVNGVSVRTRVCSALTLINDTTFGATPSFSNVIDADIYQPIAGLPAGSVL